MEATDGRRVGAAGRGGQLLGAPADVPVALFLPAESGFQPGSRRRALSVPRAQRTAARAAETSGPSHPHPRTPGRQRAAAAAAPAGRRPPARRAASVNAGPPAGPPAREHPAPGPGAPRWVHRALGGRRVSRLFPGQGRLPDRPSLSSGPGSSKGPNAKSSKARTPGLSPPNPPAPSSLPVTPSGSHFHPVYIRPIPSPHPPQPRHRRAPSREQVGRPPCSALPLPGPAVHQALTPQP